MATVEEFYLLSQIARGLGSANIDHRLRQLDFREPQSEADFPHLGLKIADVERLDGVLVIGSNLRYEMPMLAHRLRKAAVRSSGAKIVFLNPRRFDYMFPIAAYALAEDLVGELAAVVRATAAAANEPVPAGVAQAQIHDVHRAAAAALMNGTHRAILLGTLAQRHPAYSRLKTLSSMLAGLCGASVGCITEGSNAAGAYLAGAVPHRAPGGAPAAAVGLSARAMMESTLPAYVLFGGVDPAADFAVEPRALAAAELVVAITSHLPESLRSTAHVVLPIGTFAETSGTFVNAEGRWQSWNGAAKLVGDSRPGWKVLRVLANLLNLHGVDYLSSEEVRDALKALWGTRLEASNNGIDTGWRNGAQAAPPEREPAGEWVDIPPYQCDVLVRGSDALSKTKDGRVTRTVL
jgi:NADH-quinone oxidoreductase subunit G